MSKVDVDLRDLLAKVLPTDVKVTIRHLSSTPTASVALFAPSPGEEPEPTFCENHFLSTSITPADKDDAEIIVFGVEVLVYTTTHLTTIFVSKADSTGHLHLLKAAPKGSLLRRISSTFLSFLVDTHQRPAVRLVVSLFARSQSQYLFPGSIENPEKHVLDDRGLIKWWCRSIDPILREYEPESDSHEKGLEESAQSSATAYLIVPGCDKFETRGFFPNTAKTDHKDRPRWLNSYPLHQLCSNPSAPPRCLVPRLPDDPKTRFLLDLDDELPGSSMDSAGENAGQWRSVKSLDQFWEMMSFRQECSAGRLVGFLWLVVNPPGIVNSNPMQTSRSVSTEVKEPRKTDATTSNEPTQVSASPSIELPATSDELPKQQQPSEIPKDPKVDPSSQPKDPTRVQPTTAGTAFYWPQAGRGHAVLSEEDYKVAINFLLRQDFFNEEVSFASTKAFNEKVASLADQLWVGQQVTGKSTDGEFTGSMQAPNTVVPTLLVRKRKKNEGESEQTTLTTTTTDKDPITPTESTKSAAESSQASGVNVLQANLIRKKKKT